MNGATTHSIVLVATFAATAIINYAFGVGMSWLFPPSQFGILGVAQSLLLLLALTVGSGFAWTAAQDFAASGVTDETRRRFRSAWLFNVILGLGLGGGLWVAFLLGWIPLGEGYRWVVPLVSLTTVLLAARSVVNGVVRGLYKFVPLAVNQIAEALIKAAAGLALVFAGTGVAGVMGGFALGTAAALAHSLWVIRGARLWHLPDPGGRVPDPRDRVPDATGDVRRLGLGWLDTRVATVTAPLFLGMFGTAMMLNLDILGLKLLSPRDGDELVGIYQAAVILARTPVYLAQSLTLVLFSYAAGAKDTSSEPAELETADQGSRTGPHESQMTAAEGRAGPHHRAGTRGDGASAYLRVGIRAWARLLLPGSLALILAPEAALLLFFPARYTVAASALRIAAAGGAVLALVTLLIAISQAAGGRRPALVAGLATGVQIVILITLVPRWGALGAALSLLAAGTAALAGLALVLIKSRRSTSPGSAPRPRGSRPRASRPRRSLWRRVVSPTSLAILRSGLPLIALVVSLWLLPEGGRGAAFIKLGGAALAYLAAMALVTWWPSDNDAPSTEAPLTRFVQTLLGER